MPASPSLTASPLPRLLASFSLQEYRRQPWRSLTALLAIALGVALGFAVHVINQSALDEFSRAVRSVNGQPDLEFRGMRSSLPQTIYPLIALRPEVQHAAPWIEGTVQIDSPPTTGGAGGQAPHAPPEPLSLHLLGGDALQSAPLAPALQPRLFAGQDRLQLFAPDAVFLNPAALQALGLDEASAPGALLPVRVHTHAVTLRVAGTVAAGGAPLAVMDIGAAQDLLGQDGQIQRVDVLLRSGTDRSAFTATLRALPGWPAQVLVQQPGGEQQRAAEMSRAYRVNLTVLALVALFTGAFLVFSVLALSVARRAPQLALLAVLGLTPAQRMRLVLWEAALLGVAGSAAGIALGTGLAWLALRMLGGDLGGGYFAGGQPPLLWSAPAAATFFALGLAATVAGAWWPARTARALPPAATLKGLGAVVQAPARAWTGLALVAASALLASVPPIGGIPLAAYVAVGLMLLGGMALLPWLLERVLGGLQRLWPATLRQPLSMLALERARRMRASASVAVGGVVASLSLAVALTVMVTSFRGSMLDWLDAVLPSPLYLRAAGGSSKSDAALLPPTLLQAVRDLPGVEHAQPMRATSLWLDPQRPAISLLLRPLHGPQAQQLPWVGAAPAQPVPAGMVAIYVSEAVATLYGVQAGQPWPLLDRAFSTGLADGSAAGADSTATAPTAGAAETHFFIAGIWRDYIRQFGAVAMDWGDYQQLTGDARMSELSLWPAAGEDQATLQPRIEAALARLSGGQAPPLEFTSSAALRQRSLEIFDRSFAVTYWLQAVAIGIGLFGIAASFSAQVLARRKEFGLLTHLGLTRRQILTVVAGEGAAWTAMGALAGTLLGLGVAAILVHVVNPQSFHWTMELRLPAGRLLALACAVVLAGTLTAWWAGRQATGEDAVLAVKEDW